MHLLPRLSLSALLGLSAACDKGKSDSPAATSNPETAAHSPVPRLKGSIRLPSAVPAAANAVFSVRVPSSVFESVVAADPTGIATAGMADMKKDLDEFFGKTVGIQILDATSVTAFVLGEDDFGVVLTGVGGAIKSTKVGEHQGIAVYGDGDNQIAQQGDVLIVGSEAAVQASIDATSDATKSATGGELDTFIASQTDGATMVIAGDLTKLPRALTRNIPDTVMIDRAIAVFGWKGLVLRAEGDKAKIDALAAMVTSGLATATDVAQEQRRRALRSSDDVAQGAAAIIGAHYMRSAKTVLAPRVEDGALTILMPMKAGDPAILAAVAGIGAAIAIPAFSKYTRRSKTSEARVQLAKLFDATAAYYIEEHVERGENALDLAPHRCPNNGEAKGQTGITPPLSVDCSKGPGGRCVPGIDGSGGDGYYDFRLWQTDVWEGLNFQQEQAHYFHYNFIWENDQSGFGACLFTAQAFGDLDGDGVFSTFERAGAADMNGVNGAAGLYVEGELE